MCAYLIIEQDEAAVRVFRLTDSGFLREIYLEMNGVIPLGEIGAELAMTDIYDGVVFVPEKSGDDA